MTMILNIIHSYRDVVTLCDAHLLGKTFEEDKFQLDLKESFFKGEKKSKEEIILILKEMHMEDATFNIVGKKATAAALEAGIITKKGIGTIANIPFALILA